MKLKDVIIVSLIVGGFIQLPAAEKVTVDRQQKVEVSKKLTEEQLDALKILIEGKILILDDKGNLDINEGMSIEDELKENGIYTEQLSAGGGICY